MPDNSTGVGLSYPCLMCDCQYQTRADAETCERSHVPPEIKLLTGGSSDYYKMRIEHPTSGGEPYDVECNDVIEALGMTFAEGNVFKAIWRHARAREGAGLGKPGSTTKYEAEKIVFFGERLVELAK